MKLIKFIFIFIASIIIFVFVTVGIMIALITGGKDFDVLKNPYDLEDVIGESVYDAFENRNDEYLNIDFSEDELNGVLTKYIIDNVNSDYADEDVIYSASGIIDVKKVKIELNGDKAKVKARIKYGPLKTNFVADGKISYDSETYELKIKLTKAKLGHLSVKNPSKYLKNISDNEYIKDGNIVYPLNLDEKINEGISKIIVDNCNPNVSVLNNQLRLSFNLSSVINEGEYNNVSYVDGQMRNNVLSSYSPSDTQITISNSDFNGYIKNEYTLESYEISEELLNHTYTILCGGEYNDIYFDNVSKKLYVEALIQGIHSYFIMDYTVSYSATNIKFNITNVTLNGISIDGEFDNVFVVIIPNMCYNISIDKLESSLGNAFDIVGVSINSNNDFIFDIQ